MPGNPANNALGTICHFYAVGNTCRVGIIITVAPVTYVAVVRQLDQVTSGAPTFVDRPGIPMDNDLAATGTWHYANVCTNLS